MMRNLLLTFGLAFLRVDASLQDVIATKPIYGPTNNHDLGPSPTDAPLIERAEAIAPNICGFFMGTNYCKCALLQDGVCIPSIARARFLTWNINRGMVLQRPKGYMLLEQ